MSVAPSEPPSPLPRPHRRRRRAIAAFIIAAAAVGLLIWRGTAQDRHYRQLQRLADWINRARATPPPGADQFWSSNLSAPYNCLFNPLSRPAWVPTEKVRELADYLDATDGKPLRSMEGLFGFNAYLETICPYAKDYGPFQQLRLDYPNIVPTPLDLKSR